jgi:hypothetical protein
VERSSGDDSLARRYTQPTSSAHSSSGLGHRPLTAAARVRIPYGPFRRSQLRAYRMVTRVRCARCAANARRVRTPVRTSTQPLERAKLEIAHVAGSNK